MVGHIYTSLGAKGLIRLSTAMIKILSTEWQNNCDYNRDEWWKKWSWLVQEKN